MVLPGETVALGAQKECFGCRKTLEPAVCRSRAGYYVGYWCKNCGPHSRESEYYKTEAEAQKALDSGEYSR